MDNQLYEYAMPESMRERVERNGRVLLDDGQKTLLTITKLFHCGAVMLLINVAVVMRWNVGAVAEHRFLSLPRHAQYPCVRY